MTNSFERKFTVNSEGEAEEVQLTEEERKKRLAEENKKGGILEMAKDRKFVVGEEGDIAIEGDSKEKLAVRRKDGSVEKFVE